MTGEFDLVVGTRLHSLILATSSETPIVAISYHTKVQDYMSFVGLSDRCLQMDDLIVNDHAISEVVKKLGDNWEKTITETKQVSNFIKRGNGRSEINEKGCDTCMKNIPVISMLHATPQCFRVTTFRSRPKKVGAAYEFVY